MQADDKLWFDAAHKVRQICHEIQGSSEAGQRVLVLAHFAVTLALVEASLRDAAMPYERFSAYDFDRLCEGPPALRKAYPPPSPPKGGEPTAGGADKTGPLAGAAGDNKTHPPAQGRGRVWLGLARSFQTANHPASRAASAAPPVRIIVAEHHPRETRDLEIMQSAATLGCESQIGFHISLDDPLLEHFGGASLRPLLEKLGFGEGECISHPLVTSAIRRAQEKIEKQVQRELPVESIAAWFKYNLPEKASW